jgi:hypothetical protein
MNIRETYKECDTRLEKNYKQEFETYPPSKLDKIWDVIQENHNFAKAPELGNIFKYMVLTGLGRVRESGDFYNRCTEKDSHGVECGTKYSLRAKLCPNCNRGRNSTNLLINTIEIVKTVNMPNDLIILKDVCAICPKYKISRQVKGAKCPAWGTHDEYKKIGLNCKDCCCNVCCNRKPVKGFDLPKSKTVGE